MIVDILFAIGIIAFALSNFRQLQKLLRTKKTDALSATKYKIKAFASSCTILACILAPLPIALVTNIIDISITIVIVMLIAKYRKLSVWRL